MGIELMTSSLPRMRSTPELHRLNVCLLSGKRGSNSRPSAWKADALPTELLPQKSPIFAGFRAAPRKRKQVFLFSRFAPELRLPYARLTRKAFEDLVGGGGLEPPNPEGADLQSAAIATMRTSQKLAYQYFQSSFEPIEGFEPTTPRLQITCSGQLSYIGAHESFIAERTAKVGTFFETAKLFHRFFDISVIS